ncbi:MAG: restriction endonuclease subunit S [Salinisphaeraceae bacterium]|nr:restriction endonuclease subunit S [Salinisphaeraceae bacterium]
MTSIAEKARSAYGDLPEGWTSRRLRFDARLNPKKSGLAMEPDELVSFVPMDAVGQNGGLKLGDTRELADVYEGYTYFANGDLCIAKITPCFENGKGAIAERLTNGVGFGTTELHVVRPGPGIDRRFLFYVFIADDFRKIGESEMYGAGGQKRIDESFIKDWMPPLPPLETQRRIAQFLDEKTACIDGLIEKKRALLERLAEKRQSLITRAVTKGLNPDAPMKPSGIDWLGDIPAHWEVLPLKRLVVDGVGLQMGPFGGMLTDLPDYDTGYKLYGQENTISGDFSSGSRWVEYDRYKALKRYEIIEGDLVLTRKGSLGNCRRVPGNIVPGIADSDTIRVRPRHKELLPEWALLSLHESVFVEEQISVQKRGAILSGLNTSVVALLLLTVPPTNEQLDILYALDKVLPSFDDTVKKVRKSIASLEEYRAALITAAVTGQLELNTVP